jgi:hypothetical protein
MEEKKSSNYFGSFLDAVLESPDREGEPETSPLKLLEMLEENGPQRVSALQTAMQLDLITFSKAVENMEQAKLIQLSGEPSAEIVSLTPEGHTLASMQESFS